MAKLPAKPAATPPPSTTLLKPITRHGKPRPQPPPSPSRLICCNNVSTSSRLVLLYNHALNPPRRLACILPVPLFQPSLQHPRPAPATHTLQLSAGVQLPLEVFMTESKGWGVRCREEVPAGAFVCCYVGQLITDAMAEVRGREGGREAGREGGWEGGPVLYCVMPYWHAAIYCTAHPSPFALPALCAACVPSPPLYSVCVPVCASRRRCARVWTTTSSTSTSSHTSTRCVLACVCELRIARIMTAEQS